MVLASGMLKDSGKVGKIRKISLSTCQLFNLSTKKDVAGELPFAKIVVADPWSAKCSGRITIRLFKRIVDRGQWIVESG